jgi:hypothetical protein
MILLFTHIIVAISSVIYSSLLFLSPTKRNFKISYTLIGATLLSGTYLVISTHAHLLSSCEAGLAYIGIVLFGLILAQYKLTHIKAIDKKDGV